ncbi:MAG: hypothetical protein ACRDG8_13130 [Actinomycetota bacterium]
MEIAVWIIAGIFALNALMLAVLVVPPAGYRARREIRQLETLWSRSPSGS